MTVRFPALAAAAVLAAAVAAPRAAALGAEVPAACTRDEECTFDTLCIDSVCKAPPLGATNASAVFGAPRKDGCLEEATYSGVFAHEFTREEFLGFFIACVVTLMIVITAWELLVATRPLGQVVPVAAFSLILGMVFGYAMRVLDLEGPEEQVASFSNSLFLFVLLPPIIYESAFMMDRKTFFHNVGTILIVVIPGVLLSTGLIGMCTYWAGHAGWFTHDGNDPLDFSSPLQPFLFGALISATDPVATLAILSTVHISPVLFALVFGESMLNDAVSIVVYEVLKHYGQEAFTLHAVPIVIRDFFSIAIGSVVVGLGVGLASSALHRRVMAYTHHSPSGEMAFLMLLGYFSYVLAEVCGLSGITALLVCGIVQRYYAFYSVSHEAQHGSHHVLKLIASKAEQFIFLYLGINVFLISGRTSPTSELARREWGADLLAFAGFSVALVTVARLVMVLVLCGIANLRRQGRPITLAEQMLMWWAGLRGAMAFALAKDLENEMIVSLTITVVLFTTFVQGCSTAFVVRRLGLIVSSHTAVPNALLRQASKAAGLAAPAAAAAAAAGSSASGGSTAGRASASAPAPTRASCSTVVKKRQQQWDKFDRAYMRPYFGGPGLDIPQLPSRSPAASPPRGPTRAGSVGSGLVPVGSSGGLSLVSQYSHDMALPTVGQTGCILDTVADDDSIDAAEAHPEEQRGESPTPPPASVEEAPPGAAPLGGVWREMSDAGVIDSSGGVHFWRLSASTLPNSQPHALH